jgi:hypothetical protein
MVSEWCSLVGGKVKANRLTKIFVDQFRDKLPKAVRKCPISGELKLLKFKNILEKFKIFFYGFFFNYFSFYCNLFILYIFPRPHPNH